ncbi:hypothetical protein CDD83_2065 [Cordyceps sp. RAO-2017]|nr:hypothetical protein CDD83_2065 [Cordyceps sp. RAO-2017]
MPRASSSGKRQQGAAAGHRDARHENGLVGPGKRISAKKSHGLLNGAARAPDHAAAPSPSPPPPPPPPPSSSSLPANGLASGASPKRRPYDAPSASSGPAALDAPTGPSFRRGSLGTSSDTSESCHSAVGANGALGLVDGSHRQIDVNAMKNADVHRDSGPLELAATVVRSLPVQDTLAILIILMHIPYLSLTLVYACFASLTFVPPVASKAGWNINFGDILDSNSHTPSLATVMCMDFFFFLIWVFLWQPIQDSILEFAKPVIAVTLGGGTSAKDGTSRGVTACFTWILLHKLVRASKSYWPRLARHVPDVWHVPAMLGSALPTATTTASTAATPGASLDKRDTHGWVQSILAMHILTQGIVRYIREWYLRRERFYASAGAGGDPEAGKPPTAVAGSAGPNAAAGPTTGDSSHDAGGNAPEAEAGTPLVPSHPAAMTKKKRKQSAQVRLQQPLWAALASTKIVAMKEIELSSWGSGSSDKRDIHNSGNTPSFDRQPKQIWISYIGSDEVCFSTSHFPEADDEPSQPSQAAGHAARPAGVDTSKPLYVRINNAFWQPTRIFPVDEDRDDGPEWQRWTGDIYGLRPASKYVCEFVDMRTDRVLFTTSIRTVKEPLRDDSASSSGLPNGQQPLRPDSPATTLRTSIAAAEAKLADEKGRIRSCRKEWKTRINGLKKENEQMDNQLSSAGGSDDKYRQKIKQQQTLYNQSMKDIQALCEQLKNFDSAPELTDRKKAAERAYYAEKKVFDAAQKELKDFKSRLEREVKGKDAEQTNLKTRRNKIATRIAKVETEVAAIADANSRGLDEAERRKQERAKWSDQATAIENNYTERLAQVLVSNNAKREHIRNLQAQLRATQGYLGQANGMAGLDVNPAAMVAETGHAPFQRQNPWNSSPLPAAHYPWATTASSGDMLPPVSAPPRAPSSGAGAWHPPPAAQAFESRAAGAVSRARGRSSSMLSDVSGFTHLSDDGSRSPPIGMRHRPQPLLGRRNGASGSSGSSGGSVNDPTNPT